MTQTLKAGDRGALVALLQLALERAGQMPGALDGIFGAQTAAAVRAFQAANALVPDGIAGAQTHRALLPYYTGFVLRTVRAGDTFSATPVRIPYSSALIGYVVRGLAARYPTLAIGEFGRSVLGKPLWYLTLGSGEKCVFYNAAHHANEWITTPLLLTFCEQLCARLGDGGVCASGSPEYRAAADIAAQYPDIPFPSGWKANIRGIDLNLQYPAGWSIAREIKFAAGYTRPGPRDYVGPAPLTAPESLAMYGFTRALDPQLTLSYHTQGRVIYWQYDGYDVPGSKAIARQFAAVSGYDVAETPYAAGHAGYKDWFLQDFRRPGFTIEAGSGENPLPLSQFPDIWSDNLGILLGGMAAVL